MQDAFLFKADIRPFSRQRRFVTQIEGGKPDLVVADILVGRRIAVPRVMHEAADAVFGGCQGLHNDNMVLIVCQDELFTPVAEQIRLQGGGLLAAGGDQAGGEIGKELKRILVRDMHFASVAGIVGQTRAEPDGIFSLRDASGTVGFEENPSVGQAAHAVSALGSACHGARPAVGEVAGNRALIVIPGELEDQVVSPGIQSTLALHEAGIHLHAEEIDRIGRICVRIVGTMDFIQLLIELLSRTVRNGLARCFSARLYML